MAVLIRLMAVSEPRVLAALNIISDRKCGRESDLERVAGGKGECCITCSTVKSLIYLISEKYLPVLRHTTPAPTLPRWAGLFNGRVVHLFLGFPPFCLGQRRLFVFVWRSGF